MGHTYDLSCTECKTGFLLIENICFPKVPSCITQAEYTCQLCQSGYTLSGGQCVDNCLFGSTADGNCTQCILGYTLINGICYQYVQNCEIYDGLGCATCQAGYSLSSNTCTDNCQSGTTGVDCTSCVAGTRLVSFICYPVVANCATYTAENCTACNSGFTLALGQCLDNCETGSTALGTCTKCKGGFSFASGTTVCYSTIPYCLVQTALACTSC